jgi:hypothetical protein
VLTGTTTELNLADFSRANDLNISAVTFEDFNVRDDTYLKGGCDSTTGDKSSMAGNLAAFPVPDDHLILPETFGAGSETRRQPMGGYCPVDTICHDQRRRTGR